MTSTPRSSATLAFAFTVFVLASSANAQPSAAPATDASSTLDLEAHALPEAAAGPRADLPEPTASSRAVPWNAKRANRGAFLAGFGTGLAIVSVPFAVGFGRSGACYSREPSYSVAARYWGSVAAGLGGAMAITGSGLLFSQRRSARVAHREPQRGGLHAPGWGALGFVLGILASGALVIAPSSAEVLDCISS